MNWELLGVEIVFDDETWTIDENEILPSIDEDDAVYYADDYSGDDLPLNKEELSNLIELIEVIEECERYDLPLSVYRSGEEDGEFTTVREAQERFCGVYSSGADYAESFVADVYGLDAPYFVKIDWQATWENLGGLEIRHNYKSYIFSE